MQIKSKLSVRDAMTSKVITIIPDATLEDAAKLMIKRDIGGLVVEKKGEPVGIITEKDFTISIAKGKVPSKVKVKDVMSSPLITVPPEESILDAAHLMSKKKIRKLPVKSKGRLVGIITSEDIARVAPKEIELLTELAVLKGGEAGPESEEFREHGTEGECETCGNYSDYLSKLEDGTYVCGECKETEEGKEEEEEI